MTNSDNTWDIVNRELLLQQIADQLKHLDRQTKQGIKLCSLEVVLKEANEVVLRTDLTTALDCLVSDIYWNEESNWSGATLAEVGVI